MKRPPEVVEVPVTQADIDNGRCDALSCPIALAANRLDKRNQWCVGVAVAGRMPKHDHSTADYYSLGADARTLVDAFDKGEDVQPQTVHLHYSPGAVIIYFGDSTPK